MIFPNGFQSSITQLAITINKEAGLIFDVNKTDYLVILQAALDNSTPAINKILTRLASRLTKEHFHFLAENGISLHADFPVNRQVTKVASKKMYRGAELSTVDSSQLKSDISENKENKSSKKGRRKITYRGKVTYID